MTEWFYRFDGKDQGPINTADLKHVFDSGALPLNTPVWSEGMADWRPAAKLYQFSLVEDENVPNHPPGLRPSVKAPPSIEIQSEKSKETRMSLKKLMIWSAAIFVIMLGLGVLLFAASLYYKAKVGAAIAIHNLAQINQQQQAARQIEQGKAKDIALFVIRAEFTKESMVRQIEDAIVKNESPDSLKTKCINLYKEKGYDVWCDRMAEKLANTLTRAELISLVSSEQTGKKAPPELQQKFKVFFDANGSRIDSEVAVMINNEISNEPQQQVGDERPSPEQKEQAEEAAATLVDIQNGHPPGYHNFSYEEKLLWDANHKPQTHSKFSYDKP